MPFVQDCKVARIKNPTPYPLAPTPKQDCTVPGQARLEIDKLRGRCSPSPESGI